MRRLRSLLAISAALAALAIAAPAANAGQVFLQGGDQLRFFAGDAETNIVTLDRSGDVYTITDTGAPLDATIGGCTSTGTNSATCPVAPVDSFSIELRDLNDTSTIGPGVVGEGFNLTVSGDAGNDTLNAAPNFEFGQYFGGDDNDSVIGGPNRDRVDGGDGNDTVLGGGDGDSLDGGDGSDTVLGQEGDGDTVDPGSDNDGADVLSGGPGLFDDLSFRNRDIGISVTTNGAADDGQDCPGPACEGDNVAADFERIDGTEGNDVIRLGAGTQVVLGGAGDDEIDGGAGNDDLFGDEGDDLVSGGGGHDDLSGREGADTLRGGPGDDDLQGDTFGALAADVFSGGPGLDLLDFEGAGDPLRIDLDNQPDDGRAGEGDNVRSDVEDVIGGESNDVLIGNGAANELIGGRGSDRLVGRGGADGLFGGSSGDVLVGGKASDLIEGGSGPDLLRARDGRRDQLRCGSAADRALTDRRDRAAADCERVRRGRRLR